MAVCADNTTDMSVSSSQKEKAEGSNAVKTFICQSTIIPASRQGFLAALSSQSINLADTFLGKWTLDNLVWKPAAVKINRIAVFFSSALFSPLKANRNAFAYTVHVGPYTNESVMKTQSARNINPPVAYTCLSMSWRHWCVSTPVIWWEAEFTLDRSPVSQRGT